MKRNKKLGLAVMTAAALAIGTMMPLPIFAEDQEQSAGQAAQSQSVRQRDAQQNEQSGQQQDEQSSREPARQQDEQASASRPSADQQAIHALLAKTTEALVNPGGGEAPGGQAAGGQQPLSQLMELVSQADRQRLQQSEQQRQQQGDNVGDQARGAGTAELEQRVRQFRQDWQAKYGGEFNVENKQVVFSGVRIHSSAPIRSGDTATAAGETESGAAQPAGGRLSSDDSRRSGSLNAERSTDQPGERRAQQSEPVTRSGEVQVGKAARQGEIPSAGQSTDDAGSAEAGAGDAETSAADDAEAPAAAGGAKNTLTVMIPPLRGAAEAHVRLQREGDAWKIDLPDAMNREQLIDNLSRHVREIHRQKDNWPANETDAYKFASHHLLLALTNSALEPSADSPDAGR